MNGEVLKPGRLHSIDLLRGLTVLGMIIVNATAGVAHRDGPVFPLLLHADWAGFTIADSVFPAFILIMGVSVALSAKSSRMAPILGRTLRLVLLGLLLSNIFWLYDMGAYQPRLPGVLQRIGIVYAATALIYPRIGWQGRALLAAGVLLLYWPLCLLPSPDGLPTNLWIPGHNFASWVDRAVLGPLRFVRTPDGYDPEGLLSTFPTLAEALIGTLVGDWFRRGKEARDAARGLALTGAASLVVGIAWSWLFPIAKNLWSSSFVLVSAGITLLLLALFHLLFDGRRYPELRGGLLGSFGRNAIAAYTLHELAAFILTADALQWPFRHLASATGTSIAALIPVAIFVAIVWWPIAAMDRRGWYWTI
ncbi:acyltransferase family protein [Sphingomonas oryzagri]